MWWSSVIVVLFFTLIQSITSCDIHALQRYVREMKNEEESKDFGISGTKQSFESHCRKLNNYLALLDQTLNECSILLDLDIVEINKGLTGIRELKRKLCDDEYFQERLLAHTPCFRNHSYEIKLCSMLARQEILNEDEELIVDSAEIEEGLTKVCCELRKNIRCTAFKAHKYCGLEASEIAQELLEGAVAGLLQEKCADIFKTCPYDGYTIVNMVPMEEKQSSGSHMLININVIILPIIMYIVN